MAIQDAISALAGYQQAEFGFTAHTNFPESINPKCFTNVITDFGFNPAAQGLSGENYTIQSALLISRHEGGGLAGADAVLKPYLARYWERVWCAHLTLGGTIEAFQTGGDAVSGRYGVVALGGVEYLGIVFDQRVRIKRTVTMEA